MAEHKTISPQDGPQYAFLSTNADVAIYGGGAGGGKSWALLADAARYHYDDKYGECGAVIFRRTTPQIKNEGGLWDESLEFYAPWKPKSNQVDLSHTFANGFKISFSHLQYEKDKLNWQGAQIAVMGFDELTHFTETQFNYMMSRNRSKCPVRPYIRATCNPDSNSWLVVGKEGWGSGLISWWVDDAGYPIKERSGVLRWSIRVNGERLWADTKDELLERFPEIPPKSFTFIPSKLQDNKILMDKDPDYLANLYAQDEVDQAALLHGNWRAVREGLVFKDEHFGSYEGDKPILWMDRVVLVADTASTADKDADFTVFQAWGLRGKNAYLLDQVRGQWEIDQLFREGITFFNKFNGKAHGTNILRVKFYVENKNSGTQLLQHLMGKGYAVEAIQRGKCKYWESGAKAGMPKDISQGNMEERARHTLSLFGDNVKLPLTATKWTDAKFVGAYKAEFSNFAYDTDTTDDQISVTLDALHKLLGGGGSSAMSILGG